MIDASQVADRAARVSWITNERRRLLQICENLSVVYLCVAGAAASVSAAGRGRTNYYGGGVTKQSSIMHRRCEIHDLAKCGLLLIISFSLAPSLSLSLPLSLSLSLPLAHSLTLSLSPSLSPPLSLPLSLSPSLSLSISLALCFTVKHIPLHLLV